MSYGLRKYRTSQANTASREDLLILLYEGAIRFLERSIKEMEAKRLSEHKMYLRRGLAIVAELQSTLDFEKGGELSMQLFDLYGFMMERLTEANIKQDMSQIKTVIKNLEILLEGWRDAVRQVKERPACIVPHLLRHLQVSVYPAGHTDMEQILTSLESVLETLSSPSKLDGGDLSLLQTKWVLSISQLKDMTAAGFSVSDRNSPELRQRLESILARTPEVQTLLTDHKSEVANQLFTESRRVKAIRQGGYGALTSRPQLIQKQI